MPSLRPATPDDADTLAVLERAATTTALVHVFGTERPYPIDDIRARWAIVLDDADVTTLLAYDGDEPVGYAAFDSVELRHFGVHPDRFGTGVADVLHTEVVRRMAAAGVETVRLWVLAENRRARRFYERNGWEPDGRTGESEFPPHPTQLGYAYQPPPCP
ncbi:MAG: GNAT family N-acetyltransferase [Nocardioidaceae bacterium]